MRQSINQQVRHSADQSINQSINQSASQPASQPASQSASQSVSQPASQSVSQPASQSVSQSVIRSDEGLTLETSALYSLRWPIYIFNLVDTTKLPGPPSLRTTSDSRNRSAFGQSRLKVRTRRD